ncbi:hypothetical protein CSUI_009496 [Cystoisospora suis]|uniref:Uncharacterized protein n=1 Tax=Cystoisospora suis TaxID=483139 RepID=A0A2C6KJ70_9APIC|nr:hypothetical protein CSUI_009496 [Cystoisospora suis]
MKEKSFLAYRKACVLRRSLSISSFFFLVSSSSRLTPPSVQRQASRFSSSDKIDQCLTPEISSFFDLRIQVTE